MTRSSFLTPCQAPLPRIIVRTGSTLSVISPLRHVCSLPSRPVCSGRLLGPVCSGASAETRLFRRICSDTSAQAHLPRRICLDPSAQVHLPWRIGSDPSAQARLLRRICSDPSVQAHLRMPVCSGPYFVSSTPTEPTCGICCNYAERALLYAPPEPHIVLNSELIFTYTS